VALWQKSLGTPAIENSNGFVITLKTLLQFFFGPERCKGISTKQTHFCVNSATTKFQILVLDRLHVVLRLLVSFFLLTDVWTKFTMVAYVGS